LASAAGAKHVTLGAGEAADISRATPDLIVAGAGMGGLAAAAQAAQLGARVEVREKGHRAGGSMLLSSGVVWRHRDFERFRAECPGGDPELQRTIFDRLDADLDWLESLGARARARDTGNPLTAGARFDPRELTGALVAAAGGEVRFGEPLSVAPVGVPVVLATGGFQADRDLVRTHVTPEAGDLILRATPWSTGDGLRIGVAAGARTTNGMGEFYGRNMPAPPARVGEEDFVRLAQLYAAHATVRNAGGEVYTSATWSEIDVVQWTARQPGARAWYEVPDENLERPVRERTVGEMIESARRAGAPVERRGASTVVEVVAGITTTLGGLRVDPRAVAAPGVFACGADVGGIATGGYASGLAAALVLGRIAARSALGE
jgi:succinate dehydrogenase/fumarate reductase flavoprotein subunit